MKTILIFEDGLHCIIENSFNSNGMKALKGVCELSAQSVAMIILQFDTWSDCHISLTEANQAL